MHKSIIGQAVACALREARNADGRRLYKQMPRDKAGPS
jgi:hypothetical protein